MENFWDGFEKKAKANWGHIAGAGAGGLALGGLVGHARGKKKGLREGVNAGAHYGVVTTIKQLRDRDLLKRPAGGSAEISLSREDARKLRAPES